MKILKKSPFLIFPLKTEFRFNSTFLTLLHSSFDLTAKFNEFKFYKYLLLWLHFEQSTYRNKSINKENKNEFTRLRTSQQT